MTEKKILEPVPLLVAAIVGAVALVILVFAFDSSEETPATTIGLLGAGTGLAVQLLVRVLGVS